jgi:hypothetical protein
MPALKPLYPPTGPDTPKARNRLFIGLALGTAFFLCLLLLLGWVIPLVGFSNIHPALPYFTGFLFLGSIVCILFGALCLVVHVRSGRPFPGSGKFRGWATRFFLPLMELVGRLGGVSPTEVRQSFIKVNNELVSTGATRYEPEELLILLPHCIQRTDCDHRLSYAVDRCRRCGRCPINGLLDLRDRYKVQLAVASGGSIARRIVVDKRPRFILAVACERDLSSGIQDTYPLPVFGLLNERPEGPCRNTLIPLSQVEEALRRFIRREALP